MPNSRVPSPTGQAMPFRLGFQITYHFAQPTPMVAMLDIHDSHAGRVIAQRQAWTSPQLPLRRYRDRFGNTCTRLVAPAGQLVLRGEALVRASVGYERPQPEALRLAPGELPEAVRPFLQPSRYCETGPLARYAHLRFAELPNDRVRVQAICAHVARALEYAPEHADCSRSALRALQEGQGVCRDFAHVAIALCRSVGIPARYCTGYPPVAAAAGPARPGFSAWFEAWFDGRWQAFDPRQGGPCPARVPVARGRDAADAAASCGFGPCEPERIEVWAVEQAAPTQLEDVPGLVALPLAS